MTIQVTATSLRALFPRAPRSVIEDNVDAWQLELDKAGISHTRTRLAYFFANIEHECNGFTIPNLTENVNYTAERMAQVWPNRFKNADAVRAKFGTGSGWQLGAFNEIYGNRMGNRPGTADGSRYIGRGGPQWTGRDGYKALETATGLPVVDTPALAARHADQPAICCAFWAWKGLNRLADAGNFAGAVKIWNGGTNGMADRLNRMAGNDPILARLQTSNRTLATARRMPGQPPTPAPTPDVIADATKEERAVRTTGTATVATGTGAEITAQTTDKALLSPVATWALIGVGVGVFIIATIMVMRKTKAVKSNWF